MFGYWRARKEEIWDQCWPHVPELSGDAHAYAVGRQTRPEGRIAVGTAGRLPRGGRLITPRP
ncbi:hypothetical protein [Lentzea atacamensis]|uniref:hypothetical protein n=1 Tax=Lentzea atacamensis TaxID=531938 RepID=UPI0011B4C820|nr:hypothetical protein [Lentzea atacamensis]